MVIAPWVHGAGLALGVMVNGTYNVLEAARRAGARKVVAASSASVYGMADAFPTTEAEADAVRTVLAGFGGLQVTAEALADADWLAMALSGLPPVRAGRAPACAARSAPARAP